MRKLLAFTMALLIGPALRGQQVNSPHAGYVYPAGGQQGTTVQIRVGGQFLDGVTRVLVSGNGVRANIIGHNKPLNGQQLNDVRDRLQELQKRATDPSVQKEMTDLRNQLGDSLRRNASPVLSEIVTLEVTLEPGAAPGVRSLRLVTLLGLSNPLTFCVGQLPEFREKDEKGSLADAELSIQLPAVVNGRIIPGDVDRLRFPLRQAPQYMPGDVDRYRFQARKGEHVVAVLSARELLPYLADAVPGWFQATLALFDATGRELAYDDDYRFHPDPVLHYQVPRDGEYVFEIKDALFRGREDFVYRLTIGDLPFVTSIFPLGGRTGSATPVQLAGWNLPATTLRMPAQESPGTYPLFIRGGDVESNHLPFAVDGLPETVEREPNDSSKNAQAVALPVIVNGRIQRPGDWDVFSFKGRAGDEIVAEVSARRLESPLDSVVEIVDAAGRRLAVNDDFDDKGAGIETHHADSFLRATLPKNGTYFVRLGDIQHKGGAEYGYRIRISPPRPDFELRATPSGLNAAGGAPLPFTVHALRRDGFSGEIALALTGAPAGFTLSGGVVPAGQDQVRLTLTAPPVAIPEPFDLRMEGRAIIDGHAVVRPALPVDDMMQAFAYRHLVPATDLKVTVGSRGMVRVPARVLSVQPVQVAVGGTARVRVALPPAYLTFDKLEFDLSEPPEGLAIGNPSIVQGGAEFELRADPAKLKVQTRGNLIVTISGERIPPPTQQPPPPRRRVVIGTLPAIAFEVVKGS